MLLFIEICITLVKVFLCDQETPSISFTGKTFDLLLNEINGKL